VTRASRRALLPVALSVAAFAAAPARAAAVHLVSFPDSGAPGTQVAVDLSGFPTAQTVTIGLDSRALTTVAVQAGSPTEAVVRLPADVAAGAHALEVEGGDGSVLAQAPFTVTSAADASVVETSFPSRGLRGPIKLAVYLPPNYATGALHYPVVYFLHGLPAAPTDYRTWMPFVQHAMGQIGGLGAIVVVPQAARRGDPDPEYHDWGQGRNWETELALELPRFVDQRYRTIPNRHGRALIGVSAGGYGAFAIGLHHLGAFSAIESWSGYFEPTDASGRIQLDLGSPAANARATAFAIVPGLARILTRTPTFIGFYVGQQDVLFRSDNVRLHDYLEFEGVPHSFAVYPGGHQINLWSAQAPAWIESALQRLAPPS
jgi:enterochelin esterase-like enzyme